MTKNISTFNLTTLQKILISIGISQTEAETYLLLLKNPKHTVTSLAINLGIHRNYVYVALEQLQLFGLVEFLKNYSGKIIVSDPAKVLLLISKKKLDLEVNFSMYSELLPSLNNIYEQPEKRNIKVFKDKNKLLGLLYEIYSKPVGEIYFFGGDDIFVENVSETFLKYAVDQRVENNNFIKIITTEPAIFLQKNTQEDKAFLREWKILPRGIFLSGSFHIFSNTVVFWNPAMNEATWIEDKSISDIQKSMFEMLWKFL